MQQSGRRRSVRRGVAVECRVHSGYWDGPVTLVATNLSNEGMWLESDVILEPGEELVLSFVPPGAVAPLYTAARVVRVEAREGRPSGMGLSLLFDCAASQAQLAGALAGLPPTLPQARLRRAPQHAQRSDVRALFDASQSGAFPLHGLVARAPSRARTAAR